MYRLVRNTEFHAVKLAHWFLLKFKQVCPLLKMTLSGMQMTSEEINFHTKKKHMPRWFDHKYHPILLVLEFPIGRLRF
jgi:hypothetical protein